MRGPCPWVWRSLRRTAVQSPDLNCLINSEVWSLPVQKRLRFVLMCTLAGRQGQSHAEILGVLWFEGICIECSRIFIQFQAFIAVWHSFLNTPLMMFGCIVCCYCRVWMLLAICGNVDPPSVLTLGDWQHLSISSSGPQRYLMAQKSEDTRIKCVLRHIYA